MVNVREGLTQSDEMVAQLLYKSKTCCLVELGGALKTLLL